MSEMRRILRGRMSPLLANEVGTCHRFDMLEIDVYYRTHGGQIYWRKMGKQEARIECPVLGDSKSLGKLVGIREDVPCIIVSKQEVINALKTREKEEAKAVNIINGWGNKL